MDRNRKIGYFWLAVATALLLLSATIENDFTMQIWSCLIIAHLWFFHRD